MALDDFIDAFDNDEIAELAGEVRRNEVSPTQELALRELLEATSMTGRQAAFEDRPAIVDLLVALGLDFDFPDGEIPTPDEDTLEDREREAAENGAALEPRDEPDESPREPAVTPPRGRRQPEAGRPSPFGAEADKEIASRFFSGNVMKGQAWVAAEQERLSRYADRELTEFWDVVGADIWGGQLTHTEFVDPENG